MSKGFYCGKCGHFVPIGELRENWLFRCPRCDAPVEYRSGQTPSQYLQEREMRGYAAVSLPVSRSWGKAAVAVKLVPAILSSFVLGFGLGFVPGLNEHLRWNLFFILPVGGFFFGMVASWIQFGSCYLLDRKIGRVAMVFLLFASLGSYALVDYGTYLSTTVYLKDAKPLPPGDYRISDLLTFRDYMSFRLGSTSVSTRHGMKLYEMGATGTTLSYMIDLMGAIIGALGGLLCCIEEYPYWWRSPDS